MELETADAASESIATASSDDVSVGVASDDEHDHDHDGRFDSRVGSHDGVSGVHGITIASTA